MPRRRISESQGIPLSTVRSWTQDIVSAEATQIKCVVCGKKKRTLNIKQVYCSISCKNRANYQRRRQRQGRGPGHADMSALWQAVSATARQRYQILRNGMSEQSIGRSAEAESGSIASAVGEGNILIGASSVYCKPERKPPI